MQAAETESEAMRRIFEQLIVDCLDVTAMLIEAVLWGIPLALCEIAGAMAPETTQLLIIGGTLWILFW